jgi:hypothetical protein
VQTIFSTITSLLLGYLNKTFTCFDEHTNYDDLPEFLFREHAARQPIIIKVICDFFSLHSI